MIAKDLFALVTFTLGLVAGGLVTGVLVPSADPKNDETDLIKARYNINCPLKFHVENELLVVKSFSCTLDRKDVVKLDK